MKIKKQDERKALIGLKTKAEMKILIPLFAFIYFMTCFIPTGLMPVINFANNSPPLVKFIKL